MRPAAAAVTLLVVSVALATRAHAQTPAERLARGISAYRDLDYDSAAVLLRTALDRAAAPPLHDSDRVRGLAYLGATELFRERRDSAAAAFTRLLIIDPRYRPDQLVFPPEVSSLFQQVRLTTRAVAIAAPPVTRIAAADDRLVVWLYSSSTHPVDAEVVRIGGLRERSLYAGTVGDSLRITWDGRTDAGAAVEAGSYVLRVDSRGSDGRVVRSVGLPLEIAATHLDTLPLPPPPVDSLFRPETVAGGTGTRSLATGLVAAAVAVVMPSLIASGTSAMRERFAVAGALGVAGAVGYQLQRRPQPIPANIGANAALRAAWRAQADSVRAQNVARRQQVRLVIRTGDPYPIGVP